MNGIKANAQIRVNQDSDLVLKNLKLKTLTQSYDEVLLTTDRKNKQHRAIEYRIFLKDGLLFRNFYGKTGSVEFSQVLIPMQLVE